MAENNISAKINKLNQQVEWFYGEDFSLDQAAAKYKEAAKLAREIEKDLNSLKNEISQVAEDFTKE